MRIVRALATVAIATGASVGVALATPLSAHAAGTAMVSILHAVPNTPVDVCANGKALLTNFQPGTLTDPHGLPAGDYDLKITAAGRRLRRRGGPRGRRGRRPGRRQHHRRGPPRRRPALRS